MAGMNAERKQAWAEYFQLSAEMVADEEKFYEQHWANELFDSPHALISVIETKISRAVLAEQNRIKKAAETWVSELEGHDGECNCSVQAKVLTQFIQHEDFTGVKPE